MAEILRWRSVPDRSDGERVSMWHPITGQKVLVRPESVRRKLLDMVDAITQGGLPAPLEAEPWPLLGIRIEGKPPRKTAVNAYFLRKGEAQGWLTVEGENYVHRPGGPAEDPWRVTHTFRHLDAIVLHTLDGDVRYRVTEQPDKYHDGPKGTDSAGDPTAGVRWHYSLALEAGVGMPGHGGRGKQPARKGRVVASGLEK